MPFNFPPRKSSNPQPFRPRPTRFPSLRRSRAKTISLIVLALVGLFLIASRILSSPNVELPRQPKGNPPVVIVTVLDGAAYGRAHTDSIVENRQKYAARHGYETMFVRVGDHDLNGAPMSWNRVIAMRHALTKFPDCGYLWYLDQDGYIMDATTSLEERLTNPDKLESLVLKNHNVAPPNTVIKTSSNQKASDMGVVVTQDLEGLSSGSFVVRNSEWAKFFLETWFDPLYRSHSFKKAEAHALAHIAQWHPTILSKLAIIPQDTLNSYNRHHKTKHVYKPGDFVVRAPGCTKLDEQGRTCESELASYLPQWRDAFRIA